MEDESYCWALSRYIHLTRVSATELARRYGGVSQAAISKTVQRAESRPDQQRGWKQKLARLEKSVRAGESIYR